MSPIGNRNYYRAAKETDSECLFSLGSWYPDTLITVSFLACLVAQVSQDMHCRTGMTKTRYSLPVRINYEDTDAGGVVYYANYLAYMERARNACLREMGFPLSELQRSQKLIFVVAEASLRYLVPARLDDLIEITLEVLGIKGASVSLTQQAIRDNEVLVDSTIKLVTLNSDTFSPCRIPEKLRQSLEQHRIEYGGL